MKTRQLLYILLIAVVYILPISAATTGNDVVKIMLIGDSITRGEYDMAEGGLRKQLYNRLTAGGYNFDFVGGYGAAPLEGHFHDQRKIDDFFPSELLVPHACDMDVTGPMNTFRPNLVAIHLGTNSINVQNKNSTPYEINNVIQNTHAGEMATLVSYLLRWHNGEYGSHLNYILVSLIVPVEDTLAHLTKVTCIQYNMEINRMALDFRSGKITGTPEPVYVCDQFSRLQENPWLFSVTSATKDPMFDSLHPKKATLYKMGDNYYDLISYLLTGEEKWFREITWEANVAGFPDRHFGYKGVAVDDVTGDGLDDIYITRNVDTVTGIREAFYKSNADLPYTESAVSRHINDVNQSRGAVFVDIDNDGDYDLFNGNSPGRNRLYRNLENEDFQEITTTAGIANLNRVTTSTIAFDCENDGDMDLFALNSETQNEFYMNNGTGVFTLATRGLEDKTETDKYSLSATAADYDNDGDVDVLAVKRNTNNKLWINNGTGSFTDGAAAAGVIIDYTKYNANGANWADFDNDGDLDLVISAMRAGSMTTPLLQIFKNNGSGVLQNISSQVNIGMSGYSVLVGDFDNDGRQDLLTTNDIASSELYLNKGNWVFAKQTDTGAEIYAGDIRGGVVFDYDNDGDVDFLVVRADAFNVFMRNNLNNSNHYLKVKTFGPNNNIGGYGTKIWIYESGYIGNSAHLLGYKEVISASGHISQYSPVQHFGLGAAVNCDVRVKLTDGTEYTYTGVAANSLLIADGQSTLGTPEITGETINGQRHLLLTWNAINGATGYNIYRSASPVFTPDLQDGSNRIATVVGDEDQGAPGIQWTDTGITVGESGKNYFYCITPLNSRGEGPPSHVWGGFNYELVTTETTDFNEIALSLHNNTITTAGDLMSAIPNCNSVAKWNSTTQGYDQYIPGLEFTNFAVLDGYPYYVNVITGSVFTLTGMLTTPLFTLMTTPATDFNEIMLPLNKTAINTAQSLLSDIPFCNSVAKWDAAIQGYTQYIPGLEFTNFATLPGYPYYVNVTQRSTWPVNGLLKTGADIAGNTPPVIPGNVPHAVYGNIMTNAGITGFSAWIIGREEEKLHKKSPGCMLYDSTFIVQTGSFKQGWKPGDKLKIEFFAADGSAHGTNTVLLTANSYDSCSAMQTTANSALPGEYRLLQNYPNPFNPETTIEYEIPAAGFVTLDVYNTSGQHIRTLINGKKPAGRYKVVWKGRNDAGLAVSSGTYFYRMRCGSVEKKMKAVLIR